MRHLMILRPIGIAVAAYLLFGVTGLGIVVLFVAAMTIASIAYGPKPEDIAAVIGAIEATYPDSNAARITRHLNRADPDGEHFAMAKVFGILELLEDEGTVESFTVEGENHPARQGLMPRPKVFWRVIRNRPRRKPKGRTRTVVSMPGLPVPA